MSKVSSGDSLEDKHTNTIIQSQPILHVHRNTWPCTHALYMCMCMCMYKYIGKLDGHVAALSNVHIHVHVNHPLSSMYMCTYIGKFDGHVAALSNVHMHVHVHAIASSMHVHVWTCGCPLQCTHACACTCALT